MPSEEHEVLVMIVALCFGRYNASLNNNNIDFVFSPIKVTGQQNVAAERFGLPVDLGPDLQARHFLAWPRRSSFVLEVGARVTYPALHRAASSYLTGVNSVQMVVTIKIYPRRQVHNVWAHPIVVTVYHRADVAHGQARASHAYSCGRVPVHTNARHDVWASLLQNNHQLFTGPGSLNHNVAPDHFDIPSNVLFHNSGIVNVGPGARIPFVQLRNGLSG